MDGKEAEGRWSTLGRESIVRSGFFCLLIFGLTPKGWNSDLYILSEFFILVETRKLMRLCAISSSALFFDG